MGKTCIVLYELLNQSFHIGNVVVWPKLDWQAAERLNRESQGFDQKVGVAPSNVRSVNRKLLAAILPLIQQHESRRGTLHRPGAKHRADGGALTLFKHRVTDLRFSFDEEKQPLFR